MQAFQMPTLIECNIETLTDRYGEFVAQPLERGWGITLGNALRRILLSSIEGAAISAVRVDGVLHEFTSIPGVLEDVTDIILNLKAVQFICHAEEPKTLRLSVQRSGRGQGPRHPARRHGAHPQPRGPHRHAQRGGLAAARPHPPARPRLRARRVQQGAGPGLHPHRLHPLARPEGELRGGRDPRRRGHRLRAPQARGLDERRHHAPAGPEPRGHASSPSTSTSTAASPDPTRRSSRRAPRCPPGATWSTCSPPPSRTWT